MKEIKYTDDSSPRKTNRNKSNSLTIRLIDFYKKSKRLIIIPFIISIFSGIVLMLISDVYTNKDKITHNYSWKDIVNGTKELSNQIIKSSYKPTLIVGIGRGGAVISALLSGTLEHTPLIVLDREYFWPVEDGFRQDFVGDTTIKFTKNLDRVLLVAGDCVTGETAKTFILFLKNLGAKEIRFATFVKVKNASVVKETYYYEEINNTSFHFPWRIDSNYLQDSRGEGKW